MVTKVSNVCSNVDIDLVECNSANLSGDDNDMGCDGIMTTISKVKKIPPVLCIYASMHVANAFLFSSLVPNINLLGNKLLLHSAILSDGSHFKTIIHLDDKCWLHYDDMVNSSQSYAKDVSDLDVTGQKNF